jgi:hypothetical protein
MLRSPTKHHYSRFQEAGENGASEKSHSSASLVSLSRYFDRGNIDAASIGRSSQWEHVKRNYISLEDD